MGKVILLSMSVELVAKALLFVFGMVVSNLYGLESFGEWVLVQAYLVYVFMVIDFSVFQVGVSELIKHGSNKSIGSVLPELPLYRFLAYILSVLALVVLNVSDLLNSDVCIALALTATAYFFNIEFLMRANNKTLIAASQTLCVVLVSYCSLFFALILGREILEYFTYRFMFVGLIYAGFVWVYRKEFGQLGSVFKLRRVGGADLLKRSFIVLLGGVFARLYFNSDLLLIDVEFGQSEVGIYSALTVLYIGVVTLKGVFLNVLFPRLCVDYRRGVYRKVVVRATTLLAVALTPVFTAMYFFGERFIGFAYGDGVWGDAYASVFFSSIILAIFIAITSMIPVTLHVVGRSGLFLKATVAASVANITGNLLFLPIYGLEVAVWTTLLAEVIVVAVSLPTFVLAYNGRGIEVL